MFRALPRLLVAALVCTSIARSQDMHVEPVAGPFTWPIGLESSRHAPDRLWVVERLGTIQSVVGSTIRPVPFLDIRSEVDADGENGLFALALHPRYPAVRRCYVHFVRTDLASVVREYVVADPPDSVVPDSGVDMLVIPSTVSGHRGGAIDFGPDGMLYVAIGDHGFATNSRSLAIPLGKILRLDVDAPAPHVPADNPYAAPGDGAHDLIWATGLRNPWRISFDRGSGDLWIADVGGGLFEEVNVQRPSAGPPGAPDYRGGIDYGWGCYEGTHCTGIAGCTCPMSGFVAPTFVVPRSEIIAIIGGHHYRGSAVSALQGCYIYAGHLGEVWSRTYDGVNVGPAISLAAQLDPPGAGYALSLGRISSLGEDSAGEICILVLGESRWLWRIRAGPQPCVGPDLVCTSLPNSTGQQATLSLNGSPCLSMDEVSITVARCTPNATGRAFVGRPFSPVPFGNGLLCLGGTLVRTPTFVLGPTGVATIDLDPSSLPFAALPGETWGYQFVFRDHLAPPAFMNTTEARSFTFGP